MLITKEYKTETAHRLWNNAGACQYIHGHSYKFKITIRGVVDEKTGMICDFKLLKSDIVDVIGGWDHALLLHKDDPLFSLLTEVKGINLVAFHLIPTAENMAMWIAVQISCFGYDVESVEVHETATSFAIWRN